MDRVDSYPAVARLREDGWFLRITSAIVTVTFLWLLIYPDLLIAKEAAAQKQARPAAPAQAPAARPDPLNEALESLQRTVEDVGFGVTAMNRKPELRTIRERLQTAHRKTLAEFAEDAAHIERHDLPDVIRQRHAQAVAEYKAKANEALSRVNSVLEATLPSEATDRAHALADWLGEQKTKRSHQPLDPNNLPFSVPDADKTRKPKTSPEDYADLFPAKPILLASAGELDPMLLAQADTPSPEYLQPTEDVQITPAIEAKAAELDHDPVAIYNWVRNNVEFIPTYGSAQGSDFTLQKLNGNAFDIASLLIALFRASDIPARYAYGTVEIPIEKVMNWIGGMEDADAAQTLLSTGGIPNTGTVKGGKTTAIRMEHVWVEAWVDYEPSRGAKHIEGDTWVPMDASYKQYTYTDGMDIQSEVPIDAESFLDAAQEGATVNEDEGWIQNLNQTNIENQLNQYQQQLENFVNQEDPEATVGEVLGTKAIQASTSPILAAGLPYRLLVKGATFAALPDSLRHKFRYALYTDARQRALGSYILNFERSTATLAGKKVTLVFVPSTEDDREAIESYLPEPNEDGSPVQPEDFPSSLPGYQIHVTPELRVEGEVVAEGGSFTLGTELLGDGGFTHLYDINTWDTTQNLHIAGQASALGLSIQGIGSEQLRTIRQRLKNTKDSLEIEELSAISGEQIAGDTLTAAIWGYFAAVEALGNIAQRKSRMIDNPALSYGLFHAQVVPEYRYGIVYRARLPGAMMDISHQRRVAYSQTNDEGAWVAYNRLRGQQSSSMEHVAPELFLSTASHTAKAVSAVKAIAIASSGGQKIYSITQENQEIIDSLQHSVEVIENIKYAVKAGKEVIIHAKPISFKGFNGAGYIITDPATGAGAYLIEGGANGSFLLQVLSWILIAVYLNIAVAVFIAGFLTVPIAAAGILITAIASYRSINLIQKAWSECNTGIGAIALTVSLLTVELASLAALEGVPGIIFSVVMEILPIEPNMEGC